jgi:hypothetical protein
MNVQCLLISLTPCVNGLKVIPTKSSRIFVNVISSETADAETTINCGFYTILYDTLCTQCDSVFIPYVLYDILIVYKTVYIFRLD